MAPAQYVVVEQPPSLHATLFRAPQKRFLRPAEHLTCSLDRRRCDAAVARPRAIKTPSTDDPARPAARERLHFESPRRRRGRAVVGRRSIHATRALTAAIAVADRWLANAASNSSPRHSSDLQPRTLMNHPQENAVPTPAETMIHVPCILAVCI